MAISAAAKNPFAKISDRMMMISAVIDGIAKPRVGLLPVLSIEPSLL